MVIFCAAWVLQSSADMLQKDAALSILGYIYFKEDSAASAARILAEHVLPIARDQTADTLLRARVPFPFCLHLLAVQARCTIEPNNRHDDTTITIARPVTLPMA